MYRDFKKSFEVETSLIVTRSLSNLSVLSQNAANEKREEDQRAGHRDPSEVMSSPDPEVLERVRACWETVSAQCESYSQNHRFPKQSKAGWQTVRVFVSSTFTDFFWERESLVKKVFPELREWCESRQLYLVECDLRWGVLKDTSTSDTIRVCLEELDQCLEETEGQAFFLTMLGERYGWIPAVAEIPDSVREMYDWVPETSITFMEILHGAYRLKSPNALFMIRNGSLLDDIPKDQKSRFKDNEDLHQEHLKQLKSHITARFPDQVFNYTAIMEGLITKHDKEMVKVGQLDDFCDKVLQFFKKAIETHYPGRTCQQPQSSVVLEENASQERALTSWMTYVPCRLPEMKYFKLFEQGDRTDLKYEDGTKPFARKTDYWEELAATTNYPLCVTGPSGIGKTSLLAAATLMFRDSIEKAIKENKRSETVDSQLFYHFCGKTAHSSQVEVLLQCLIAFLKHDYSHEFLSSLEPLDQNSLKKLWKEELMVVQKTNKTLFIIIDALDQLSTYDCVDHLSWLPPRIPGRIHCFLSTSPHPPTVARVMEHPAYYLPLGPLAEESCRIIIKNMLVNFNKHLDEEQLEFILKSDCGENALWLHLVCKELRIYGDFRSLNKHIQNITVSLEGMIEAIMSRLVAEDETGLAKKALLLAVCAVGSLTATDMQRLLGNIKEQEPIIPLVWAQLRRHLDVFLRPKFFNEEIHFVHNKVKSVIRDILIKSTQDQIEINQMLADYVEFWSKNARMMAEDLPIYLQQARLQSRLVNFLRKVPEASKVQQYRRSALMNTCRCRTLADPVIKNVAPVYICTFCKMQQSAYFPGGFHRNSNMCVVCGGLLHGIPVEVEGHLCPFHAIRAGVQPKKCFLCQRVTDTKLAVPGKLCMHCSFGMRGKQCVYVEQ